MSNRKKGKQSGVAILLVLFVVTLASIIVTDLSFSTYLGSRVSNFYEKSLQAEYLLKSALNIARVLLQIDTSEEDTPKDLWGKFAYGIDIPAAFVGLTDKNVRISLEITPEDKKLNLAMLKYNTKTFRDVFARLFKLLGFDDDGELDQSGLFPDKSFKSEELVAILVEAQRDQDDDQPYTPEDQFAKGIKDQVPKGSYPNAVFKRLDEIAALPGFTPNRMRKLAPYVTATGASNSGSSGGTGLGLININWAESLVIQSLHPDLGDAQAKEIHEFSMSEDGPFTSGGKVDQISNLSSLSPAAKEDLPSKVGVQSHYIQVVAKVDYGTTSYFLRAFLRKEKDMVAPVLSMELY